jgi:hypothetical protein
MRNEFEKFKMIYRNLLKQNVDAAICTIQEFRLLRK